MSRPRKIIVVIAVAMVCVAGYFVISITYELGHVPEAYAAWDTGTLLVEYMKTHQNHWPKSWDELVSVVRSDTGHQILLRGSQAGDVQYAEALQTKVLVDWTFDPAQAERKLPVTRLDGSRFPFVWREPNEMIRTHLRECASSQPTLTH